MEGSGVRGQLTEHTCQALNLDNRERLEESALDEGARLLLCGHRLGSMPVCEIPRRWVSLVGHVCGVSSDYFYFLKEIETCVISGERPDKVMKLIVHLIFSKKLYLCTVY